MIYSAATRCHAFPLGASPLPSGWCPDGTVQTWSTHDPHRKHGGAHLSPAPKLSASLWTGLRAGWKTHGNGGNTQFLCFYVVWIWPHQTCCYLIRWLSCLPRRSGALVQLFIPTQTVRLSSGVTCVGEKKAKRSKNNNKKKWEHVLKHNYGPGRWWLFLQRPPPKLPTLPLPSPYRYQSLLHNWMHIKTAFQLMLIQLS